MNSCLLLVDCQQDFLDSPGLVPHRDALCWEIRRWLEAARRRGWLVIHLTTGWSGQEPEKRMPHWLLQERQICQKGTPGHLCPEELQPRPGEWQVGKSGFSPFVEEDFNLRLRAAGVGELVLCGLHLHACLRATALDAYQRGYAVSLAAGAWGSDDPLHAAITLRYLEDRCMGEAFLKRSFNHHNPHSRERLFRYRVASEKRLRQAVACLRQGHPLLTPEASRLRVLELQQLLEKVRPHLVQAMVEDIGKPVQQAHGEIDFALGLLNHLKLPPTAGSEMRRVTVGRLVIVTPFNNPVAIPLGKLLPAMLWGNSVAWKPAPAAQRISDLLCGTLRANGWEPDQLQCIHGGAQTARRLAAQHDVEGISFSGGQVGGWALAERAVQRWAPFQAELGGNNACILWSSARPDLAALETVQSAFNFAGQRCTATRRVIVPAEEQSFWLEALIAAQQALVWGHPEDPQTQVGPLVDAQALERAQGLVERARRAGARTFQTSCPAPGPGYYCPPTLVSGLEAGQELAQVESFAPLLVVLPARSFPHALELAEKVPQGLVASLYDASEDHWHLFQQRVRCGVLKRNRPTASVDPALPFGGWKGSGFGPPEHGPGDAEFFSRWQTCYSL